MTHAEIVERARQRAETEGLQAWKINDHLYLVKSRKLDPGSHHMVTVDRTGLVECDCPGCLQRRSCTHVEVVRRRLEREQTKAPRPANVMRLPARTEDDARAALKRQAEQDIRDIWG